MRALRRMEQSLCELWDDSAGLTSVEYALLLTLVVVAGVVAFRTLGQTLSATVANSADTIASP